MGVCCVQGCDRPGVFRARTRPTWCQEHLEALYRSVGLELLEPVTKPSDYLLTRCLHCGFEGHYRLEYVLSLEGRGEQVCRACFWRNSLYDGDNFGTVEDPEEVRRIAERNGFKYLGLLSKPGLFKGIHATKCRACGRIEAQRACDLAWGCTCSRNQRSAASGSTRRKGPNLLRTCDLPQASWWDHERNPDSLWQTAKVGGRQLAWWRCPEGHEFEARIFEVTRNSSPCPSCHERWLQEYKAQQESLKGKTIADIPELRDAWVEEDIDPATVLVLDYVAFGGGYRFRCPEGHQNTRQPESYLRDGCSTCKGKATRKRNLEAAKQDPNFTPNFTRLSPEIASQWHPTKNGTLSRATVSPTSKRNVVCGHEFQAVVRERDKYQRYRCPICKTVLDSLAFQYPELADEWAPENSFTPWHIRPMSTRIPEPPTWVCRNNPEHRWQAMPASRIHGSGCPQCRTTGKSDIELRFFAAAKEIWPATTSGERLRSTGFHSASSWQADILIRLDDRMIVVEYDGAYWHKDKADTDLRKTRDLLDAGFWVCRIRENSLEAIGLSHPHYLELTVYPTAQNVNETIEQLAEWIGTS